MSRTKTVSWTKRVTVVETTTESMRFPDFAFERLELETKRTLELDGEDDSPLSITSAKESREARSFSR